MVAAPLRYIPSDDTTTRFWGIERNHLFNDPANYMVLAIEQAEQGAKPLSGHLYREAPAAVQRDMSYRLKPQWKMLAAANLPPRQQMGIIVTHIMQRSEYESLLTPAERGDVAPNGLTLVLPNTNYRIIGRGIGKTHAQARSSDMLASYLSGVAHVLDVFQLTASGRDAKLAQPIKAPTLAVAANEHRKRKYGAFTLHTRA